NNRKKGKRLSSQYSKNTVELARNNGHTVARLLWEKIMTSASPRAQQMLLTFLDLRDMLRSITPKEYEGFIEQPVEHKQLAAQIQKGEKLLIGPEKDFNANDSEN
ncbi:MAG: hypothetical protein WCC12_13200, partial [Anaerolineales bacterium]